VRDAEPSDHRTQPRRQLFARPGVLEMQPTTDGAAAQPLPPPTDGSIRPTPSRLCIPEGVIGLKARWPGLAAAYVGAVVGAGFASGREIMHFFVLHGTWGLCGAAIAGVLFGAAGAAALQRATAAGHRHYGTLMRDLCGGTLGAVLDHLGTAFLFVGLVAVTAGAGALGHLLFRWPGWCGLLVFGGGLALSLATGRALHLAANLAVMPVLAGVCLVAGVSAFHAPIRPVAPAPAHLPWPLAAVLYVAYNLMMGVAGLCAALDGKQTLRDALWGGWLGGLALGVLCVAATLAMLGVRAHVQNADLPLAATLPAGIWRFAAYPLALFAALWTTGSAAAVSLGARISDSRPRWMAAALAVAATPFALLGLSPIVTVAYPLMGYAGVPLLGGLAFAMTRDGRTRSTLSGWQRPEDRLR